MFKCQNDAIVNIYMYILRPVWIAKSACWNLPNSDTGWIPEQAGSRTAQSPKMTSYQPRILIPWPESTSHLTEYSVAQNRQKMSFWLSKQNIAFIHYRSSQSCWTCGAFEILRTRSEPDNKMAAFGHWGQLQNIGSLQAKHTFRMKTVISG